MKILSAIKVDVQVQRTPSQTLLVIFSDLLATQLRLTQEAERSFGYYSNDGCSHILYFMAYTYSVIDGIFSDGVVLDGVMML